MRAKGRTVHSIHLFPNVRFVQALLISAQYAEGKVGFVCAGRLDGLR
jgi:hypothetical protein